MSEVCHMLHMPLNIAKPGSSSDCQIAYIYCSISSFHSVCEHKFDAKSKHQYIDLMLLKQYFRCADARSRRVPMLIISRTQVESPE